MLSNNHHTNWQGHSYLTEAQISKKLFKDKNEVVNHATKIDIILLGGDKQFEKNKKCLTLKLSFKVQF